MNKPWNSIVDDVQGYFSANLAVFPRVNHQFLEALAQLEVKHAVCLLPATKLELYHLRLQQKVQARLQMKDQKVS